MDKATKRARAWHRYRTRKDGPFVPPALEGCFSAGFEAGWQAGREAERETLQVLLKTDEPVWDS